MLRRSLASALLLFTGVSPAVAIMPFPEVMPSQGVANSAFREMLASGTADDITMTLAKMMLANTEGNGGMWKGRSLALMKGVIESLVWMRDSEGIVIDEDLIRRFMSLDSLHSLTSEKDYPTLPREIRMSVRAHFSQLPGYDKTKGAAQHPITLEHHDYMVSRFTETLDGLRVRSA